jgi:hypothetical protein
MLEQGKTLYTTFIDYSAAFDTVSHKYIDKALKKLVRPTRAVQYSAQCMHQHQQ